MNRTRMMSADESLERCFEKEPSLATAQRGALETQLDHLKEQLLQPVLTTIQNAAVVRELRRAANEAAALAWFSACPVLVLPMLLEEKLRSALLWWERQERIRPRPMVDHKAGAASC